MSETSEATHSLSARIKLIEVPIASPGQCVGCGKSRHEKGFVDPKLDFEFYGTVYFCADCGGEIANVLGYISPEQAIMLAKRVKFLEDELETHRDALLNLESAVEHLTDYRMLRSATSNSNFATSVSGATDEASEITDETPGGTVVELPSRVIETESDISESVNEQGSDDVSGSTGDDSTVSIIDL